SNSLFIALILKTPDVNMVKDFRPISLIGSMFKIIAKILANRLVFVLGDLVNECRSKKKQSLVFKVDFEKAFDSVRWDYLDDILRRFGFGKKWCSWIQSFLRSSRGLVIVNGSPAEEFQFHKGLKQGDPLSPFLFILVMESLHISFQRVVDAGMFKVIMLSPSLISLIFYADDAIFMGQWNESNLDTIVHVLECFHHDSSLRINMSKSKLMGIYVEAEKVSQAAKKIGCVTFKTPFTYLGSKVGGRISRIQSWNETIEGMATRLSKWKMKTLSIGELSCLNGCGASYLKTLLYGRMLSNIFMEITVKFVNRHFVLGRNLLWDIAFKILFPRVYALESCKNIDVALKLSHNNLAFSFRRDPRGGVEQEQLESLMAKVEGTVLVSIRDRWVWSLNSSGDFSVASVRKMIDEFMLSEVASRTRWIKVVPIKVNVLAWKIKLDYLPTRLNISRRGMDIDSILCPMCGKVVESTRHVFFTCHIARNILRMTTSWWDIMYMEISSYEEWLDWISSLRLPINHKRIFEGVCYVMWWHIWNFRNKTIFG
ncbi:RNA-directed DNA polymerase, eukaryota, reverse transcriptase zinc-binding domain protein, partial [Tanacetum coccineum]